MAHYETMLVTTAKLEEEVSNALINKFKNLVAENGTIDSVEDWGKRRLAYPIMKQDDGIYTLINFTSDENFPAELDRVYKITEGVLRTIIIAKSDEEIALIAAEKERKAKAKADMDARRAKAVQEAEAKAAQEAEAKAAQEAQAKAQPQAEVKAETEEKQEASE